MADDDGWEEKQKTQDFQQSCERFQESQLLEILKKTAFHPCKFCKIVCNTCWKFKGQKPRPMEIPNNFFSVTAGSSTSFSTDPWNLCMLFPKYRWKFHILKPPQAQSPCLDLFWNGPFKFLHDFQDI